jgi:hypothetical protein
MAKSRSPQRTSKTAQSTESNRAQEPQKRLVSVGKDTIDEATARAHDRARERTGSDD